MFHGVYIKSRPKGKWHLISLTASPEMATMNMNRVKHQAELEGNDTVEVGVQLYESLFNVPETLSSLKDHKILFN